jgi:XTP/dITP diphosphohydrolase
MTPPRMPRTVVLATGNAGKLREMREIMAPWDVEVRSVDEYARPTVDETGLTFVENALLKARHAAAASGLPAIADDSGLEVDALRGAPGIRSARYAGPDASDEANNERLLRDLAGTEPRERTARYRCAMVFLRWAEDPAPLIAQAAWEGTIAHAPRGSGGFGYDPLFLVDEGARTAAELTAEDKNRRSHRGQALRRLIEALTATS